MALTDNLVAYYKLDESSGNATDATGNGYTLTNNGTTTFTTGLIGNCADYGTANSTKYFNGTSNLGITNGAITISTWIKMRTEIASGSQSIALKGDAGTDVNYIMLYEYNGGTRRLAFNRQKQGITNNLTYGNATLGTSNWHHVVLRYDGTNLSGWLDGVQVASDLATSGNGSIAAVDELRLGNDNGQYTLSYLSAYQDETGVWSRALTADEISALYRGGVGNQYPFTAFSAKVLVVGGGGAGAGYAGGGGGGGGVVYNSSYTITTQSYSVTVGNGGAGVGYQVTTPSGENSVFNTITAYGGGGGCPGGTETLGGPTNKNGGSGGGGGSTTTFFTGGTGSQGSNGGSCNSQAGPNWSSAGGGGAGSAGQSRVVSDTSGGNGGDGVAYSISGSSVYYGGGGGGFGGYVSGSGGTGGLGGGGQGGTGTGNNAGNGTPNTGGGGGGKSASASFSSGSGGSGVVIISVPQNTISATGGTKTNDGTNDIWTFTSSGTFTVSAYVPTNTGNFFMFM